ncbi:MAG: hypothetical protein QNK04_04815 [Myxococcota bacterium]|nr:hypothetical protein [Myxococcota bacterium]
MSERLRRKRRLVSAFLVLFASWPGVHYALVRAYDVDPWKLFGWAMYCVPGPMKTVRVILVDPSGGRRRLDIRRYTEDEQRVVDRFRERRRSLGRLASPEPLAAGMLELHPSAAGAIVAVLTFELDRRTARLYSRYSYTTHWRDGRDEALEIPEITLDRYFGP